MKPIAEVTLDYLGQKHGMVVRLFEPERDGDDWSCTFEVDVPLSTRMQVHGVSSLQALSLALKGLSAYLYGSKSYREGKIGLYGNFGGDLSVPVTHWLLGDAPFPF
jgi:hypothetical protein